MHHGLELADGEGLHQGGSHRHGMDHFLTELIGESGNRLCAGIVGFPAP